MIGARDDAELAAGLAAWAAALVPDADGVRVESLRRPSAGWSNETLLVVVEWPDRSDEVVIRLPTRVPSFPVYDLAAQARVQDALVSNGVPAARPVLLESDGRWLGGPFLVMELVAGWPVGEVPAFDADLTDAPEATQRELHERFVDCLVAVHRMDWDAAGLGGFLRGARRPIADEVAWWRDYVEWAASGAPEPDLRRLGDWCAATCPSAERGTPQALCWGDARLGNVLHDERWNVTALLDWELASIGPPEMDLAWYLALDDLMTEVLGVVVPGFLKRAEMVERYEGSLGRRVHDLDWHETFALLRAAAVYDRQARMAVVLGSAYTGVEGLENPPLRFALDRLEAG